MPVLDLRDSAEETLDADLTAASRHCFELADELPLRATALRVHDTEHVLLLLVHHIAADGWSFTPIAADLGHAYTTRLSGTPPQWTNPAQYVDHALWQRQSLGALAADQEAYWRDALAGLPDELDLPADRQRPVESSHTGGLVRFDIDAELAAAVRAVAGRLGVSPFMVFQAGLAALLCRLGAGEDVPIGTPVAGRTDEAFDDAVGPFVNTLVLRTDLSGDPTVRTLLERVRDTALGAYDHQDLPFERLVEIVNPVRSAARHPLFQVMLAYQNNAPVTVELPGLVVGDQVVDTGVASFDLTVTVVDEPRRMAGFVGYGADLFDRRTAAELAERLVVLLRGVVSDVDRPVAELDVLLPGESTPRVVSRARVEPVATEEPSPSGTATEDVLRAVFADVLGRDAVGARDGFFALGGDSILSIQLVSRARAAGLLITAKDVFREHTPARLAVVAVPVGRDGDAVEPAEAALGLVPATPIMAWLRETGGPIDRFSQTMVLRVPPTSGTRLAAALQAVLDRHDVLRATLRPDWALEIVPPGSVQAHTCLRRVEATGDRHAQVAAEAATEQARLRPSSGGMLRAVWLDHGAEPGLLVLVVHHLAVDGVSWRILQTDLRTAWESGSLDRSGTSVRGWARALREHATRPATLAELPHWRTTLADAPALPLNRAVDPATDTVATLEHLTVARSAERTEPLLGQVPATVNGGVQDVLLAALALAVAQWRGGPATAVLVELEGHGREPGIDGLDVTGAVGWFTSVHPVRLDPGAVDLGEARAGGRAAGTALKTVKEQLRAVPRGGVGYGLLRHLNPGTAAELTARPELCFNYLGRFDGRDRTLWTVADETAALPPGADPAMPVRYALEVTAAVTDRAGGPELSATWSWPRWVLDADAVRELAQTWFDHLDALVAHALRPDAGGRTPSDLTLTGLSQDEIDEFEAEWRLS